MREEKANTFILTYMGCLAKISVPITKKRNLGPKTVDCVFLGYAIHSVGYRFLIVKSGVSDMHVGTIMESRENTRQNVFFAVCYEGHTTKCALCRVFISGTRQICLKKFILHLKLFCLSLYCM